ncbi:hypothetical protein ACLOJK_025684, partial [Asimina triloba]
MAWRENECRCIVTFFVSSLRGHGRAVQPARARMPSTALRELRSARRSSACTQPCVATSQTDIMNQAIDLAEALR